MNYWKFAFWTCLAMLLLITASSLYLVTDQAVTLSYREEACTGTENDLDDLIHIINRTDLTKAHIKSALKAHPLYEYMDFDTDTISLYRISVAFENGKLKNIKKQW